MRHREETEKIMKQSPGFKSFEITPSINRDEFMDSIEGFILTRAQQGHKDVVLEVPANNLYPYIFRAITELIEKGYTVDFRYRGLECKGEIYISWNDEWRGRY